MTGARVIRCPRCSGPSRYAPDQPYRPFCSERCREADFGAWASEEYRVEPEPASETDADALPDAPADG